MPIANSKIYTKCKQEKGLTHFTKQKEGKYGLNPVCRQCRAEQQRQRREDKGYGPQLKYRYGLTLGEFHNMVEDQQGLCYICNGHLVLSGHSFDVACVDHNHSTGQVRRILCKRCNTALGHVREDIDILHKMINYLQEFN